MKSTLSFFAGLLLLSTAMDASAEYYMVYSVGGVAYDAGSRCGDDYCSRRIRCASCEPNPCVSCDPCTSCSRPRPRYVKVYEVPVVTIYSSAPRRHAVEYDGEVAPFAWIPTPEAP